MSQYLAKIVNYGLQTAKNGSVMAVVQFEFSDEQGHRHKNTWRGSFNGGALQWTVKTLLVCGLTGNDPAVIADGPASGALNMEKEFNITLKSEIGQDGKTYWNVAWVNEIGLANMINRASAIEKLGDLRGQVAALRKETGYENKLKVEKLEEIPF